MSDFISNLGQLLQGQQQRKLQDAAQAQYDADRANTLARQAAADAQERTKFGWSEEDHNRMRQTVGSLGLVPPGHPASNIRLMDYPFWQQLQQQQQEDADRLKNNMPLTQRFPGITGQAASIPPPGMVTAPAAAPSMPLPGMDSPFMQGLNPVPPMPVINQPIPTAKREVPSQSDAIQQAIAGGANLSDVNTLSKMPTGAFSEDTFTLPGIVDENGDPIQLNNKTAPLAIKNAELIQKRIQQANKDAYYNKKLEAGLSNPKTAPIALKLKAEMYFNKQYWDEFNTLSITNPADPRLEVIKSQIYDSEQKLRSYVNELDSPGDSKPPIPVSPPVPIPVSPPVEMGPFADGSSERPLPAARSVSGSATQPTEVPVITPTKLQPKQPTEKKVTLADMEAANVAKGFTGEGYLPRAFTGTGIIPPDSIPKIIAYAGQYANVNKIPYPNLFESDVQKAINAHNVAAQKQQNVVTNQQMRQQQINNAVTRLGISRQSAATSIASLQTRRDQIQDENVKTAITAHINQGNKLLDNVQKQLDTETDKPSGGDPAKIAALQQSIDNLRSDNNNYLNTLDKKAGISTSNVKPKVPVGATKPPPAARGGRPAALPTHGGGGTTTQPAAPAKAVTKGGSAPKTELGKLWLQYSPGNTPESIIKIMRKHKSDKEIANAMMDNGMNYNQAMQFIKQAK